MNDQAQMAAVLLAGFFSTGEPAVTDNGLAGAGVMNPRAKPEIVEISEGTCALVTSHAPIENVAYTPGVSVTGKPIVSANVASDFEYTLRPIYEFDVRLNPLPGSSLGDMSRMEVATVTYEPETGRVLVDGQELVWLHANALRAACTSQVQVEQ